MKVVFRVDASADIGTGHVMRCLTLAEALRRIDAECVFVCREHPGNLATVVVQRGFRLSLLPAPEYNHVPDEADVPHAKWLGADWEHDAHQVSRYLAVTRPDWLIVDHYALDYRWERQLAVRHGMLLMVIDDLADRRHEGDLLLDQNLFIELSKRYQKKVAETCRLLLGPEYALLQPEYSEFRKQVMPRHSPLKHLLVFFGGADQQNLAGMTLLALEQTATQFEQVDVVVSKYSPYFEEIRLISEKSRSIQLHSDLPSLAPLMSKADLALGAGGATTWERFCLGLPALVITSAANQVPVSGDLHEMGLIEWIGDIEHIDAHRISQAIEKTVRRDDIQQWSQHCMSVCSGQGTDRVVTEMQKLTPKRK